MRSIGRFTGVLLSLVMLMAFGEGFGATPCHGADFTATGGMATARYFHTATLIPSGKVLITGGADISGYLASTEMYDPATGALTAAGSMATSRCYHTATLLPSSKVLIIGGTGSSGLHAGAEQYDPVTGTFTFTGNMATARYFHTATLLPNGKVLVTGGVNYSGSLAGAELYDPATGVFTDIGSMAKARYLHTATLLPNGKVLITGGKTDSGFGFLTGAELYDPATGTFTATGSTAIARGFHTATLLPSGKVLITGGETNSGFGYLAGTELYDPATGAFTATGSTAIARGFHTATLLPSGKVLITGGDGNSARLADAELYDPATGTFTTSDSMTTARHLHTATLLPSGKVFITGGDGNSGPPTSAELYDPAAGAFTATGSMATERYHHTATLIQSGKVLITGGYNSGYDFADAEMYNPTTGAFTATGGMATARHYHTATLLPTGKVLIIGGAGTSGSIAGAELYDPATGTFSATGNMATARYCHTATILPSGKVLITGGYGNSGYLSSAELYDPATGAFTATGSMATARIVHTASLLPSGKILITGGYGGGSDYYLTSAELYDPVTGVFTATGGMTTGRVSHTATLLPTGKVLITGGFSNSGMLADAELYNPATGVFTATGSMATARSLHSATLLPSGKVLITGEQYYSTFAGAELYDPATGAFTATGSMAKVRRYHSATLLPSGKVLITGGEAYSSYLAGAELYDSGLGFSDNLRPVISSIAFDATNPTKLVIAGNGLKGVSEASGGSTNSSATNYPLLQLQRVDNDQTSFILSDSATGWSNSTFKSASLYGLPGGTYRATIFANAIPSLQQFITIAPINSVAPTSWDFGSVTSGTTSSPATFTITNNGPADLVITAATAGGSFNVGSGSCGPFPTTVIPGATCSLTATFAPVIAGSVTTNLTISSNDPATPQATIQLSGTGYIPTYPLTVTLSGNGSVSGTTTGTPATVSFAANGSNSISNGALVTLFPNPTALSGSGIVFKGWSGACSGMGDSANNNACTITMTAATDVTATFGPGLLITTANPLPGGTSSVAYSKTLTVTGGTAPYVWSLVTGSTLPTGMSLSTAGLLGGTPSVIGEFSFTVQAKDKKLVVGTTTFTLKITPPPLTITTATLKSGIVGTSYSTPLTVSGGVKPYTWSVTSGSLPPGVGLDTTSGALNGTPPAGGTFSFTVSVRDSQSTPVIVSTSYTITIAIPPLAITTASLPNGTVSIDYLSTTLVGSGGVKPYSWSISAGKLPPGVGIISSTGVISGTPTTVGSYPVTVKLEDYNGTAPITKDFTIVVAAPPLLVITTTTLPAGSVGVSYPSTTLAATGGIKPFYWSIPTGKLPPGLTLSYTTGVLSGTPTGAGSYPVTIRVEDYSGSSPVTMSYTIVVTAPPLTIATTTLPAGIAGNAYSSTTLTATGGIKPYAWSLIAGRLPAGIGYSSSSGVISGTPVTGGFYPVTFRLEDATGSFMTRDLSITVTVLPLTITTTTLPAGTSGTAYTKTILAATGGIKPYAWGVSAGTLPPGIAFNTLTGTLSGTPTVKGAFSFTLQLSDQQNPSAIVTRIIAITVN